MDNENHNKDCRKMRGKSHAQVSIDFIIMLGVMTVIFIVVLSISIKKNDATQASINKLYAKEYADRLSLAINTIYLGGDGARRSMMLPDTLKNSENYEIRHFSDDHLIEIIWLEGDANRSYKSPVITSQIIKAVPDIKGEFNITNKNGVIWIEP